MRSSRNTRFTVGILLLLSVTMFVAACSTEEEGSAPAGATVESVIKDFTLENLTVSVGTQVVWKNSDGATHTSTSGGSPTSDGKWDTGRLSTDQSATSVTFGELGTFQYFCTIHPNMQATVTVTN